MLSRRPDGRVDYEPAAGDVVILRRAHACGGRRFAVTAVGVDIRLSCAQCGQRAMLTRARLRSRLVDVVGRVAPPAPTGPSMGPGSATTLFDAATSDATAPPDAASSSGPG